MQREPASVASVIHTLGVIAASRNDTATGRELIAHSIELLRALPSNGEPLLLPVARGYGRVPGIAGAVPPPVPGADIRDRSPGEGGRRRRLRSVRSRGAARDAGEVGASRALAEESLARFRQLRDELGAAQASGPARKPAVRRGRARAGKGAARGEPGRARGRERRPRDRPLAARDLCGRRPRRGARARLWQPPSARSSLFDRTDDGPGRAAAVMQLGYLTADAGRRREALESCRSGRSRCGRRSSPNTGWCAADPARAGRSSTPRSARPSGYRDGFGRPSRSSTTSATMPASPTARRLLQGNGKRGANGRLTRSPVASRTSSDLSERRRDDQRPPCTAARTGRGDGAGTARRTARRARRSRATLPTTRRAASGTG